jgi:predicted dehydrogenase
MLTAKNNGVLVSAFHQTLYAPSFLNVKKIIASGKLGDILQISLKYSGFSRRWDWQTLQCCCAGSIYNSGPHPIGQALDLLGWDTQTKVAFSSLKTVLTSGDSDDYGKIILSTPNKPVVDIEISCADAYADDFVFKIFGSKGTLISSNSNYKMKYIEDFSAYPERQVIRGSLSDENGNPAYCSEKLNFTEESNVIEGSSFDAAVCTFYKMMYNSVMSGAPLEVQPYHAARVISVIEQCHAENPLPIKFN